MVPIKVAIDILHAAFWIAGYRAPLVLARYGYLWFLHRTFAKRRINKIPKKREASNTAASSIHYSNENKNSDLVIPIYNNFEDTSALLEQLRDSASLHRRIILINDCSTDHRMCDFLKAYSDDVKNVIYLENEQNLGFVKSCNKGLSLTKSDVVLLNTDIEVPKGAIARLLEALRSANDIATATPFSNSAYGVGVPNLIVSNERPFGASTSEIDAAFCRLGNLEPIEVPRGVGFCMAISRAALNKIGYFSLIYGQGYGEEADFCLRAREQGYRSVIAPNAYVYHKSSQSFGGAWKDKARVGQLMLLKQHPKYVKLVDGYFADLEASAVAFLALTELARALSRKSLGPDPRQKSNVTEVSMQPMIEVVITPCGTNLCLIYLGERHEFKFADTATAYQALKIANISPAPSIETLGPVTPKRGKDRVMLQVI